MNKYKKYLFMDYNELFNTLSAGLIKFTSKAKIDTEIVAEQYRRKFTELLIDYSVLNNPSDSAPNVYKSLFDVIYKDDSSSSLNTSKYPKLALNFVVGELANYLGMSYKDFLKLTIEETDILLDIVTLKQDSVEAINDELYKDLDKEEKRESNPFIFGGE